MERWASLISSCDCSSFSHWKVLKDWTLWAIPCPNYHPHPLPPDGNLIVCVHVCFTVTNMKSQLQKMDRGNDDCSSTDRNPHATTLLGGHCQHHPPECQVFFVKKRKAKSLPKTHRSLQTKNLQNASSLSVYVSKCLPT